MELNRIMNISILNKDTLKGNWATLLLPLNASGDIDYVLLEEEIDYLSRIGVDGIYSGGTAGEFYNLEEGEMYAVNELLATACQKARVPFQIGATNTNPYLSFKLLEGMKALNPSGFQIILPDWIPAGPDERIHYLKVLQEVAYPIPLILYNPPHAKTVLIPSEWKNIVKQVPGIIGIKVADGDANWYDDMKPLTSWLAIFVPGHRLATGISEGVASGAYSNVACLSPLGAQQWYKLMIDDMKEALAIERLIGIFFEKTVIPLKNAGFVNPALDKFLAAVGNWTDLSPRVRWPYRSVDESEVPAARKLAIKLLPDFFFKQ